MRNQFEILCIERKLGCNKNIPDSADISNQLHRYTLLDFVLAATGRDLINFIVIGSKMHVSHRAFQRCPISEQQTTTGERQKVTRHERRLSESILDGKQRYRVQLGPGEREK